MLLVKCRYPDFFISTDTLHLYNKCSISKDHLDKTSLAFKTTVLIQLFLHKSTLNLGKFEAVEGVSAYSQVFLIKRIFSAN